MRPVSILRKAKERGLQCVGLTDHVFGFTDPYVVDYARAECPESGNGIQVFFGCEADVLEIGKTTVTEHMLETLDFVMVSASHFHNDYMNMVAPPASDDPEAVGRHYLEMFRFAASLDCVDVIAHPFYVMPGTFDPRSIYTLSEKDLRSAAEIAAANGVAVEISRRAVTPDHIEFMRVFYRLCKRSGVKLSVGSDAHNLETVGRTDQLGSLIQELALEEQDFWLPNKHGR